MRITCSRREFAQLLLNCGKATEIDSCEGCALKDLCGKGEFTPTVDALLRLCEVEEDYRKLELPES